MSSHKHGNWKRTAAIDFYLFIFLLARVLFRSSVLNHYTCSGCDFEADVPDDVLVCTVTLICIKKHPQIAGYGKQFFQKTWNLPKGLGR